MAEPNEGGYGWIVYLIFFFFLFLLPILKKVAEALGLVKKETPLHRPGTPLRGPDKHTPMREMLDEVEGFFRKTRMEDRAGQKPEHPVPGGKRPREYSEYDLKYRGRKQELAELRRRRDERRGRRRLEPVRKPEPQPEPALSELQPLQPHIRPVLEEEPQGLVVIEEPQWEREALTPLGEVKPEPRAVPAKEESFFDVISELPEMARMVVMSEVFSPPKSLREV